MPVEPNHQEIEKEFGPLVEEVLNLCKRYLITMSEWFSIELWPITTRADNPMN